MTVITVILAVLAPFIYVAVHEGGHYLVALALGAKPGIYVLFPHIVTSFKARVSWHSRLIMEAGFGVGMLVGLALLFFAAPEYRIFTLVYWCALVAHFWAYPWTALSGANDFDGMCSHSS
jgi:hypothetical protein